MSESLPKHINPWLIYRQHERVTGALALTDMPNLMASQLRQSGDAQVSIEVVQRQDGRVMLQGEGEVELELECQRCLKPVLDVLEVRFSLVLVKYEQQLASVDEEDDALVCEEKLELAPLFEQEFILALPMIAKHSDCDMAYKNESVVSDEDRQHPFANLKDLMN